MAARFVEVVSEGPSYQRTSSSSQNRWSRKSYRVWARASLRVASSYGADRSPRVELYLDDGGLWEVRKLVDGRPPEVLARGAVEVKP